MVIGDGCSQDTVGNCKEGVINCTCYKCIPYFSKLIFCYAIIFVITKALSTLLYLIMIYMYMQFKICLAINIKINCFSSKE